MTMFDPIVPAAYAGQAMRRSNPTGRLIHRHDWIEFFFDLRADEPGGPRTYHGIGWACGCGVEYGKGCLKDAYAARRQWRDRAG